MSDPFCVLCSCNGKPQWEGDRSEQNWHCPLLNKNICEICCHYEVRGGMEWMFEDTVAGVRRDTGKSLAELQVTCAACPHGGDRFRDPPLVIQVE